jgi:hypothetical protein
MYDLCMAKIINVYLRENAAEYIKDIKNKSDLINNLIEDHFRSKDPKTMSKEELRILIAKEEAKFIYETKLKEIENGL